MHARHRDARFVSLSARFCALDVATTSRSTLWTDPAARERTGGASHAHLHRRREPAAPTAPADTHARARSRERKTNGIEIGAEVASVRHSPVAVTRQPAAHLQSFCDTLMSRVF